MKKLITKILLYIKLVWFKLSSKTHEVIPVAIKIAEGIKQVKSTGVDEFVLDVIKKAIPGTADDVLIDRINAFVDKELPVLISTLKNIELATGEEDPNERLKKLIALLNFSSDEDENAFYHNIAVIAAERLSDGDLSWSDSVFIIEYYYQNHYKKKKS